MEVPGVYVLLLSVFVIIRSAKLGIGFVGKTGPITVTVGGGFTIGVLTSGGGCGVLAGGSGVEITATTRVGITAFGVRKSLSQAG